MLTRTTDATEINRILNHPSVRPWVADAADGVLDVTDRVANDVNVTLVDDYGALFFFKYCPGVYEVHTQVLPDGRGEWARQFAANGVRHMFTATDCVEILTRIPQGHIAAKALAEATGFRYQFTTPPECRFRGETVPCHVLSLTMQEWFPRVEGMSESGAEFHQWLNRQVGEGRGAAHDADDAHNRVVGIALAMAFSGQARKAVVWYNRCAIAARHATIALLNEDPIHIRFDAGILTIKDGAMRLERNH